MRDREQLLERYEDAGFTLMMYDFALEAGGALHSRNDNLKTRNPDMAGEEFLQKCFKTIRDGFARKKRSHSRKLVRLLPLVAVIAVLLTGLVFAASASVRSGVYSFFRINQKESTEWNMSRQPSDASLDLADLPFTISLPDDFVLESFYHQRAAMGAEFTGKTDASKTLSVDIFTGGNTTASVDNEQQTREYTLLINGNEAILRANDEQTWLTWGDMELPGMIIILASGLDDDTLIRIAESIRIQPTE